MPCPQPPRVVNNFAAMATGSVKSEPIIASLRGFAGNTRQPSALRERFGLTASCPLYCPNTLFRRLSSIWTFRVSATGHDPIEAQSDPEGDRDEADEEGPDHDLKRCRHVAMIHFGDNDGKNSGWHGGLNDQDGL